MESIGLVDLHFHGAFGIDVMTASSSQLSWLSKRLWAHGIAAFCPTTLSAPREHLLHSVKRIGTWIRSEGKSLSNGAKPLGIHLEGPFIARNARGAHPSGAVRPFSQTELNRLWAASSETIKIVTLAPELITAHQLQVLQKWAKHREIVLSLGHSRANLEESARAFLCGFSRITHAWNAMRFHHRDPGPLGAALGDPKISIEVILDQVHVSAKVVQWMQQIHPLQSLCFVSDCAPAAGLPPKKNLRWSGLKIHFCKGACRAVETGDLAGGGFLLTRLFREWILIQAKRTGRPIENVLRSCLPAATSGPLRSLGLSPQLLSDRKVKWVFLRGNRLRVAKA